MTHNSEPWYSEEGGFFGPDYLLEYQSNLPSERTLLEVGFLQEKLSLKPGMRILDMPCGHGRHTVELAKRGYDVTGVDLNRFFLAQAQEAADKEGVKTRLQQGDMREVTFENEFDVALNLFTAMGYFEDDEDDRRMFTGVFRALKSGGSFVVDFMNHDRLVANFKEKDWQELPDGSLLLYERRYDPIRGRNTDRRIRIRRGGEIEEIGTTHLRLYTPAELVKMAESVGLIFKESYGDYEGTPLSMQSRRAILMFTKG